MALKWLKIANYPFLAVFLLAGLLATIFAWNSFNLAQIAMDNSMFIRQNGLMALADGGALQSAQLLLHGLIALAAFVGFKACEVELIRRWRVFQDSI